MGHVLSVAQAQLPRAMASLVGVLLGLVMIATGCIAKADDLPVSGPPVLTIHSQGGTIRILGGGDAAVHVGPAVPGQTLQVRRFVPDRFPAVPILVPGQVVRRRVGHSIQIFRLPPRRFAVPATRFGNQGVNVVNAGGDVKLGVPQRLGALFVDARESNVVAVKLRGPFVIAATRGNVVLRNVAGRGLIRTTTGDITLVNVGGDIHIQTLSGRIRVFGSHAQKADVRSESGPIMWRFAQVGTGAYSFHSGQGDIDLQFLPTVAAQVDAQSTLGSVTNALPGAPPALANQHALSVPINGGGPEITVTSDAGNITLEQFTPRFGPGPAAGPPSPPPAQP
jgi:hypothetical protein